ncbi:MAG: ABC transporter ATP-binding protein [Anaerolineae bacterium]|nr:ABC transporter ATP-binding protein [Anaerolineae bacterium]
MPTITLQHVTKRYEGSSGPSALGKVVTSGTRLLFDTDSADYIEQTRTTPEPTDRVYALDDLSLTVRDGETLSILGPSGCGKTTLLKVIAGLIMPDEGDVLYDGQSVHAIPPAERGIGMVFQSYALYPHLPSRDNIVFFDIIHKQPERIPERIHHIVNVMGIQVTHLLSRKPPTLSGGEQQRVAIARCLARDPEVFLFDEPLSNLDAKLRVETRVQIKRLLRHYRITSVYVTHDQTEAMVMGDRIAIMRDGKIDQIGTRQALYDTPKNAFVAQFFGTPSMNLFSGHVSGNTWQGSSFSVSPIRPALRDGQPLWIGIRAEHVQLVEGGIPATVELVEPVFPERKELLYLTIAGQRCLAAVPLDSSIKPNATVHIRFPAEHLYLFDKKTGVRIG